MTILRKVATLVLSFGVLSGCATSTDVAVTSVDQGSSKSYSIPFDSLKRLAFESVKGLNVDVKGVEEASDTYVVNFSKPISAFSWGEVGKVVVTNSGPTSTVTVVASKRMRVQVTGTNQQEFAEAVFEGIDYAIRRR
jgi:hypothetical protein